MIASVPYMNCDLHVFVIAKMTKYQGATLSARRLDYGSPVAISALIWHKHYVHSAVYERGFSRGKILALNRMPILLLRSESDDPSPIDQSLGARLSAVEGPAHSTITIAEEVFCRDDLSDIERKLGPWKGKVAGVIGTTNIPESTRLGELAEEMKLLRFVANNNPSVWQRRKHVFHIGLPSTQTADTVALLLEKTKRKRIFLLYDQTEFQRRVASSMEAALKNHGMEVSSRPS
jgi:Periplasmic binding protein